MSHQRGSRLRLLLGMKEETNPGSEARQGYITSTPVPRDVAGRPGPAGDNGQGGAVSPGA